MSHEQPGPEEDRLGEVLRSAVPEGPEPIGRAEAVVRRGRAANRRRGASGVLAVGVVALAVVVGPNLLDGGPSKGPEAHPGPGPTTGNPSTVTGNAHPYTCPTAGEHQRRATVPPSDDVPAGAVLARICPLSGSRYQDWSPPLDALTTDVDVVSQSYNFLPKGEPLRCLYRLWGRPGFSVTFQYPDGHLVRVSAETIEMGQCDYISIDGRDELGRSRAGVVMLDYFTELQAQRAASDPDVPIAWQRSSCPGWNVGAVTSLVPQGKHLGLTHAVLCTYESSSTRGMSHSRNPLSPDQVAEINRDFALRAKPGPASPDTCLGPVDVTYLISGRNEWGDQIQLASHLCGFDFQQGAMHWEPGAAVRVMLGQLSGH